MNRAFRSLLGPWLERFIEIEKRLWSANPPDAQVMAVAQNGREFLFSLHVLLSLPPSAPVPGPQTQATHLFEQTREALLAVLARMRR